MSHTSYLLFHLVLTNVALSPLCCLSIDLQIIFQIKMDTWQAASETWERMDWKKNFLKMSDYLI